MILSAEELRRMKNSTLPPTNESAKVVARRAELKKLSNDKLKHWPNTLEAIRVKKENFLKEREEKMELERQEVDKQEAELARSQRLESIRRANNLIYEQTDKMKMLKSQKAYADAIHTRGFQIKEKERVAELEKVRDAEYHILTMAKVKAGEEEEARKKAAKELEIEKIKVIRKEQRDRAKEREQKIHDANVSEGERMKRDFKLQLQEEMDKQEARHKMIIQKNLDTLEENKKGQILRDEIRAEQLRQEASRDAEVAAIDHRKASLKMLEKRRFDRAQETKQRMIEAAVKQLESQKAESNAVFAKQEQDVKDREDKKEADKEAKRKKEWDDIVASRTHIINRKEEQYWVNIKEEEEMVAKFKRENEEGIQREKDKVIAAKEKQTQYKLQQLEEGKAKRQRMKEEMEAQKEQERFLQSIGSNDDARFKEICMAEIEKNVKAGKPVYTLLRALEFVAPSLLAAKTVKMTPSMHKTAREAAK